ncbi:hypothetical protein FG91_01968 [Sphingopyxis sp. LC81]|uniref:nucleoside 2-deoxyribosyltransferase domain-containing protein n=1 Tax=Sphingopyxis sp. LC81 TaxID=1502850 RepID=UPI00050F8E80|nr:nucleoside 2-deoxyribosyltransferase domain-containing protein [Sphingopyxis sp. LC81]KGB54567.1 hypothetical protein FG91_01968 [Sphingopyxis sp. LC81]
MRRALAALALLALPAPSSAAPLVVTSPQELPAGHARPRIFLGGSIDMGRAADWQAGLVRSLGDLDVLFLNPRRPDWNPAWKPVASEPEFRRQVEWELAALESADIVVMYFAPGSQSPISLLEMGLHARGGKLILLCPEGFWRKGNVDITAEKYGIEQVATMDELAVAVRRRVTNWTATSAEE